MDLTMLPHRIHKCPPTCYYDHEESADGYDRYDRPCTPLLQLLPKHNGCMLLEYSSAKRPPATIEGTNQTQPAKRQALAVEDTNKKQPANAFHIMKQASKIPGAFLEDRLLSRVYEILPRDPDGTLDVAAFKDREGADTVTVSGA